jgi:hypothetical protein
MTLRSLPVAAVLLGLTPTGCGAGGGDPCANVECSSRGFCIADQGTAYCACIRGYRPAALDCLPIGADDPCLDVDCSGHGACREVAGEPVCECEEGSHHPSGVETDCAPDPGEDARACIPGAAESCDGYDNDCDGLTDEDFDLDFDAANCGACGHACPDGAHGAGVCVLRECTVTCAPGWSDVDGNPANGCEAGCVPVAPANETACNGLDEDCDGRTDEDWTPTMRCGAGLCERSAICFRGEERCSPRLPPADTDATCDGVDDNCDGLTDEDCGTDADADGDADADADDGAGEEVPPPCTGVFLGGYCWYASLAGQSCTDACGAHGGCNLAGTRDYAGSGGTDANCVAVLEALGYGGYTHQDWSNTDLGCHFAWASWTYWSSFYPTTCESAAPSPAAAVRMCACNE